LNFKLEICADSIESALNAQLAGADRIELCANLIEGGTTPSYGTIISAKSNLNILLHVLIRPRGGDFLYTDIEYDIMRRDIETCGESGADGIVIGILTSDGKIDIDRTARLVEFSKPMSVTFHRAFDMCTDPVKRIEEIIQSGANRLLTSGQKKTAVEGSALINKLVKQAHGRIIIMPGSGVDEENIATLAESTGACEFHLTGRKSVDSEMTFRQQGLSMSGNIDIKDFSRKIADTEKIKRIIHILRTI
jgi:copper homeostasis protein